MAVHGGTVDGVPVLWTGEGGGRLSVGLVFRVGRADETLATSGVTHLLEHLVLFPVERADLHVNGLTSPGTTTFRLDDADEAEVAEFLGAVCSGLRNPPVERLDTEKAILRTEGNGDRAAGGELWLWRYGPAGFGLASYDEFGLDALTGDDVREWAATRFTKGNAALWIDGGPPPEGLRLDLPPGERMPYPEAVEVLPRLPAYFTAPVNGAVFDLVVPRSRAAMLYAAVLDRRLYAQLRRELGVSYAAGAGYRPRDARHAVVTAMADALPAHRAEMCRAMADILIELSRQAPSDAETATARTLVGRAASVAAAAESLLAEVVPEEDAVAEADLLAVARQALDGALAMLPEGCAIGRAGFVRAPSGSAAAVDGAEWKRVNRPDDPACLIIGAEGVSVRNGLQIATVRYADCRGMLAWPDGARRLFGADAVNVMIEPTLWSVPAAELARIDAAVPGAVTIAQPARAPEHIPKPPGPPAPAPPPRPAAEPAKGRPRTRRARRRWAVCAAYLVVMAVVLAGPLPKIPLVIFFTAALRAAFAAADRT